MSRRILDSMTNSTFAHYMFGPGALIADFEYQNITSPTAMYDAVLEAIENGQALGLTEGAIDINIVPEERQLGGARGTAMRFVGDSVYDSWECYITCGLMEISPHVLQQVFPTSEFIQSAPDDNGRTITRARIRAALSTDAHRDNITYVCSTGYGLFLLSLHNAIGRSDGAISAEAQGDAAIPYRVDAFIGSFRDLDFLPVEAMFIDLEGGIIQWQVQAQP